MLSQRELVQNLKEQLRIVPQQPAACSVSSGSRAFDRLLGGGWQAGTLVEYFSAAGSGASSLALLAARAVCSPPLDSSKQSADAPRQPEKYYGSQSPANQRALLVVDSQRRFYPPAAAAWQVELEKLVVVCPANVREHHWAVHQALSCSAVGAVLCWPERLDARMFRRWQLAAETSGSLGLLVRPPEARGKPSWAQVQLRVEAVSEAAAASKIGSNGVVSNEAPPGEGRRRLRVELLRLRGSGSGSSVELEIDERGTLYETNPLPVVSELAAATAWQRSAGA